MDESVNAAMIVLARELCGWTQAELAQAMGVTQATISRYEQGHVDVPVNHLLQLSIVLNRPMSFFRWDEETYGASCMFHRKRRSMSARELRRVHAQVNFLRMQATRLLRFTEIETRYTFHRLDMTKHGGCPASVARKLRHIWQLPHGPVRSVVNTIERAGGIVFQCPFTTIKVDGISQWPLGEPELPPVFFINSEISGDRQRLTLAHELGHIVMHHLPTEGDMEDEANEFAAEFLMPREEIEPELSDMTLSKAAALKSHWHVSMQAIIRRAWELGKINETKYRRLFTEMGVKGYRKVEPVLVPPERAQLLQEMVDVYRSTGRGTDLQISEFLGMNEDKFRRVYGNGLSGLKLVG